MKTVNYSIGVWHKDTGLAAFTIDLRTNERHEAVQQFNELSSLIGPTGYGLALRVKAVTDQEIMRTK